MHMRLIYEFHIIFLKSGFYLVISGHWIVRLQKRVQSSTCVCIAMCPVIIVTGHKLLPLVSYPHLNPNSAQRQKGPKSQNKQQIQIQQYQSRASPTFKTQEPNSIQTHIYLKIPSISSSSKPKAKQKEDQTSELQSSSLFLSTLSYRSSLRGGREGHVPLARSRCSSAQIKIFGIVLLQFFFFFWCKCVLILMIKLESWDFLNKKVEFLSGSSFNCSDHWCIVLSEVFLMYFGFWLVDFV